jgi:hypothetical protein
MTSQVKKKFIVFIIVCGICACTGFALAAADLPTDVLKKFVPPLSTDEKELLQSLGGNQAEIDGFVATRLFFRQVAVYKADLPKGIKYRPAFHGCPELPVNVDFNYILTDDEGEVLYNVKLLRSWKQDGDKSKYGQEHLSISATELAQAAGPTPDKKTALTKLNPPATPEELKLLDQAALYPVSEIPKFLATRLYIRQVKKMIAALPAGTKFDPATAPKLTYPDIEATYLVDEAEKDLYYAIRMKQ